MTAISLDLDETLWRLDGVIENAERITQAFLQTHCPELAAAYPPERLRVLRAELAEAYPELRHDMTALRRRTLERAASGLNVPAAIVDQAFEVFLDARHQVDLYPDALPLLDRVYGQVPMVALTNGNADVHRLGMGHYFVGAFSAIDVGAAKPERVMFEAAADHVGLPLDHLIHVGDDPVTDVAGAARHGVSAVWLNRTGAAWPAELPRVAFEEIRSLEELPDVIRRLRPEVTLS